MNHSRCWANDNGTRSGRTRAASGSRAGPAWPSRAASRGRGRRLEQRPDPDLGPQHRPDPRHQPHRQQRMPAQRRRNHPPARPPPGPARQRRSRTAAPPRTVAGPRSAAAGRGVVRDRQRRAVQLPVHRQRQAVEHHHRRGHHVLRQPGRRMLPHPRRQPAPGRVPVAVAAGDHVSHQPLVTGGVLPDGHRRLAHPRMSGQHRLHLTRLDPEPADLHLIISPPGEHQLPAAASTAPGPRSGTSAPRHPRTGTPRTAPPVSPARPRYPRASCAPATYNSPATPAGTGHNHRSSTNTRVLATGAPIGAGRQPRSLAWPDR